MYLVINNSYNEIAKIRSFLECTIKYNNDFFRNWVHANLRVFANMHVSNCRIQMFFI